MISSDSYLGLLTILDKFYLDYLCWCISDQPYQASMWRTLHPAIENLPPLAAMGDAWFPFKSIDCRVFTSSMKNDTIYPWRPVKTSLHISLLFRSASRECTTIWQSQVRYDTLGIVHTTIDIWYGTCHSLLHHITRLYPSCLFCHALSF